jgi:hypothetical protein
MTENCAEWTGAHTLNGQRDDTVLTEHLKEKGPLKSNHQQDNIRKKFSFIEKETQISVP